jgi:NADH dehydrogenase [ubiquinone] 1 alpha subcomplex assembly factor 7
MTEAYSPLETIIRAKIAARGAITVAEYMELALGHEDYGYYMTRDPFGEHGDFTTAPEISQIFGELLGAWLAATWQQLGAKEMVLLELGPGRGTLMTDALRATRHVAGFHESLVIVMVEISPALKRFQRATVGGLHPRITWQPNLEGLPDLPMLLIANEFFDALPIRQYVKMQGVLQERFVAIDPATDALTFVTQPMGMTLVKGGGYAPDNGEDAQIVESCPVGRQIMGNLAQHMTKYGGAGLVIDYGYTGASRGNTLQAVKQHGFWPMLKAVGEADITAHVAFDDLAASAKDHAVRSSVTTQGAFLSAIGGEVRLRGLLEHATPAQYETLITGYERLTAPAQMGELFKVIGLCSAKDVTLAGFAGNI